MNDIFFVSYGARAVARALIGGGGGVYSYIRVMPDGFLLKSVVFKLISKEISRADHEYMSLQLSLQDLTRIINNYPYSGGLLK